MHSDTYTDTSTGPVAGTPPEPRTRLTLRKGEKLRHRTLVDGLFSDGESVYDFPLRVSYRPLGAEQLEQSFRNGTPDRIDALQMLITVPKKKRRHAVDRVLMRRRIREAYRLNRLPLKEAVEADPRIRTLGLAIVYIHDKNLPYQTIERKLKLILKKIASRLAPGDQ